METTAHSNCEAVRSRTYGILAGLLIASRVGLNDAAEVTKAASHLMTMKTILLIPLLALAGCVSVPSTRIAFDPVTRQVSIRSPKEIAISNLVIEVQGDRATIKIGSYESKNNAAVITAVADANANTQKLVAEGAAVAIGIAKKAGGQ